MITCKLGGKTYHVDYVTGRALREIGDASRMYARIVHISQDAMDGKEPSEEDAKLSVKEAMDVMVKWFCILFQNQFSPDEVYDNYPADRLMHDVSLAIMAVNAQTTERLSEFPTKPTAAPKAPQRAKT